ncbi:hypothetical protein Tco_0660612 [Tanacetum coccineum]
MIATTITTPTIATTTATLITVTITAATMITISSKMEAKKPSRLMETMDLYGHQSLCRKCTLASTQDLDALLLIQSFSTGSDITCCSKLDLMPYLCRVIVTLGYIQITMRETLLQMFHHSSGKSSVVAKLLSSVNISSGKIYSNSGKIL